MKTFKKFPAATVLITTAACGSTDSTAPEAVLAPASVTLAVPAQAVVIGESPVLTATVLGTDGKIFTTGSVTWTTSDPTIARVGANGTRSAILLPMMAGRVIVTAAVSAAVKATVVIDVTAPPVVPGDDWAFTYSEQTGIEMIPAPTGATGMHASAVNDLGQVVGTVHYGTSHHAFIWSRTGGILELGPLPGSGENRTAATSISSNGDVAGSGLASDGHNHAFRWTAATGMRDLGLLPGSSDEFASGINSNGAVVGSAIVGFGEHPWRWTPELGMEDLSNGGTALGYAIAINDGGQIVGARMDVSDQYDYAGAVTWSSAGVMLDVWPCADAVDGDSCGAAAVAINKNGVVLGTDGVGNPFIWTATTGAHTLGGIPGARSFATAINDSGTVVGNLYGQHALGFIWSDAGGARTIPLPAGRASLLVTGINNNGLIVGVTR